jgi:hypothetical protein
MPEVSSTPPSELEKGSETHIETKELSLSASTDPYYVSPEDNKRVRRKADMVIMPVFGAIIAIQFVSRLDTPSVPASH